MNSNQSKNAPNFFRAHVLPALVIFLIPGFAIWFFSSAEQRYDREALTALQDMIRSSTDLDDAQKNAEMEYFQKYPVSKIMASNKAEMAEMQKMFASSRVEYSIFRWMKRIAWICLWTCLATFVLVGISVLVSLRSHAAQYRALRFGWPLLRGSAAVEVFGQGVLLLALSYYVTALWFHIYVFKLIAIAAVLAGTAFVGLYRAIFAKVSNELVAEGEIISKTDAPALWGQIDTMAGKLETNPPDYLIGGIDPNFYVTESPVRLGDRLLAGRTLYVSLPLLKIMTQAEADAVFGHELAHFSGQDTLWGRKIAPLLTQFEIYMNSLAGGLGGIVAHFMFCFWKLYLLSLTKLSRAREFRSDRIGSSVTEPGAMQRALVKLAGYCKFYSETEQGIVARKQVDGDLKLSQRLEAGFPAFLNGFVGDPAAFDAGIPHPFDTHPSTLERIRVLGSDPQAMAQDPKILRPVEDSWYRTMATAPSLEAGMWAAREDMVQNYHILDLAHRLLPTAPGEVEAVEKHFPKRIFHNKKGEEARLEYDRLILLKDDRTILFADITDAKFKSSWGAKLLLITDMPDESKKKRKTKCRPALFKSEAGDLMEFFDKYYGRHLYAMSRRESENKAPVVYK